MQILHAIWEMLVASSLYLLFGFAIAGLIHVFLPAKFIEKHLKKPGFLSVFKSSAFGIPLPLCSCSVIPVGLSLRKNGASKGATASFFVSTPEVGVDSFLLSYALLGPFIAIARVLVSFLSAIGIGVAIESLDPEDVKKETSTDPVKNSCCSSSKKEKEVWYKRAFRFSFVDILDDISVLLIIGFIIAGLITALIPDDFFQSLNVGSFGSMILMLLVSLPVYVCATSSTPIAAALLLKGISPGAIIVFLLAGPATNISTILVLSKELGKKSTAIYVAGIVIISLLAGIVIENIFVADGSINLPNIINAEHGHGLLAEVAAVVFSLLLLRSVIGKAKRRMISGG